MAIIIRIPTPLRKITGGSDEVTVEGADVSAVLSDLEAKHPGIKERICEDDGTLRRFVNLYLNDEDIRFMDDLKTEVKDGDELSIIPAIAGGCPADGGSVDNSPADSTPAVSNSANNNINKAN
jgi:molybdopterin synthase sulfur carrier subunit